MTIEEIKEKWLQIIKDQNEIKSRVLDDFSECPELYVAIFGEFPDWYFFECLNDIDKTVNKIKESFNTYIPRTFISYKRSQGETKFDENSYDSNVFIEKDGMCAYLYVNKEGLTVYTKCKELALEISECLVETTREVPCEVFWVSQGQRGFESTRLELKEAKFDVVDHYNDDFDYEKVISFVNGDDSGITILHGKPGTGKTYLLRHLAQSNPSKKFYFMDKSTFAYIGQSSFISFLLDKSIKDSVFVLEDCETLLSDRVARGNELLSSVLNLSDGILGDGLHIKFICTFNADLSMLDKALLRKGRLKYKYEFKELSAEKTQNLAKKLGKTVPEGKSLPVCEIYNFGEENGGDVQTRRRAGFGA